MIRSMTLALGGFGRDALEEQATRTRVPPETVVGRAVRHYLADLDSRRVASRLPRFKRELPSSGGLELELQLDLEPDVWEALHEQSRREGVAIERVLEHAVMYLVADADADRIASGATESR